MLAVASLNSTMYYILLLTLVCRYVLAASPDFYDVDNASELFEEFIVEFDKTYSEEEKLTRFEIFKANLELINSKNNNSYESVYGITRFADLTAEEFSAYHGLRLDYNAVNDCMDIYDVPDAGAPESLDWRDSNLVTDVKNQNYCGNCWAFSATGHLEGQYAKKYNKLVPLSEQELNDCDLNDNGCCGGLPSKAFIFASNYGLMSEDDYPFTDDGSECAYYVRNTCTADKSKAVVTVTKCYRYSLSQEKVKQLLYKTGPISIGIRAAALQHRKKAGVITDEECSSGDIDHAVLLVGYGTDKKTNQQYWIVKNSWGSDWGEAGYFRMERSDNYNGACGMLNDAMSSADIA